MKKQKVKLPSDKLKISLSEQKYFGPEPDVTSDISQAGLIDVYNWYNYICSNDDAKQFVLTYLESKKAKKMFKIVEQIDPLELRNIGWNLRIKYRGGTLPKDIEDKTFEKLVKLTKAEEQKTKKPIDPNKPVVSVQDRINSKLAEYIGDFESELDKLAETGTTSFVPSDYILKHSIKPMIAKKIAAYYEPLYAEIELAIEGVDADVKQAYKDWKKTKLKKFLELIGNIIDAGNNTVGVKKKLLKGKKKKKRSSHAR